VSTSIDYRLFCLRSCACQPGVDVAEAEPEQAGTGLAAPLASQISLGNRRQGAAGDGPVNGIQREAGVRGVWGVFDSICVE
jgi:hypothetical protein